MNIVRQVARRGTCDRGRTGCIIVRDKKILVTGYVGSPAGMPHCDDVGHLFHKVLNDDETTSNHCIRTTHAEQNAIVQAARHGISIDGRPSSKLALPPPPMMLKPPEKVHLSVLKAAYILGKRGAVNSAS